MSQTHFKRDTIASVFFSLRVMIPLLTILAALLLLLYMYTREVQLDTQKIYAEYKASQMNIAIRLQSRLERDLRVGALDWSQRDFSELSVRPEFRAAMLADEHDKILASSRLALIGMDLATVIAQYPAQDWLKGVLAGNLNDLIIRQNVVAESNAILIVAPVRMDLPENGLDLSQVGKVLMYTDVTLPLAKQAAHRMREYLKLFMGYLSLSLLVGMLLHLQVTRRIMKLLRGALRIGEGKLNTTSGVSGLDEIGQLGVTFDDMTRKMKQSSMQIRKLSRAVEQSPNTIIITDSEGIIEYVNPHFSQISGYSPAEVIGKNMRMHQSGMTPAAVYEELWRTIKSGQVWRGELLNKSKQGRLYWEELSISPVFDEQGHITHFLSQQIDITSRKQGEEQIRLFEKVFANTNEAILISDANNRIVATNPAFTEITGYTLDEVVGKNPSMLASGQMDVDFYEEMWSSINKAGKWQGEVIDRRKNGEFYAEWLSISALHDDSGSLTHYVALISDISERKAAEERMTYLAHHDVLTGLPNRMLFQDRLRQAISYAERQQTSVALLFLDLDRFKDVNDTLGHHVGDLLLQEVTRRIRLCVRGSDTVSRQGGDEYVIMLPNLDDLGDIVQVVNKLIESIANPYELEGHTVHVTTSVGVSVYPQDGADIETLIRNADTAMYQAKDAGRNGYRFFTQEMNHTIARRVGLENKLRKALSKNELLLHYQPQVDLRSGMIVAAEALVRWQHPEDGLTSPAEFICIAEECGMIVSLGDWVLNEACRQNQEWRAMGLHEITMAVNLSPLQLHDRSLIDTISAALSRSKMPANALELEITESAMMKNSEQAIAMLNTISGLGIRISIDDFGTGYSSLSHLKKFPVDMLKIDQTFVRDLSIDSDDAAIVSALISMAKSLGLRVIAEGVETAEQLRFLEKLDCDLIQGFHFSRPLPADEFRKLLESGRMLSRPPA